MFERSVPDKDIQDEIQSQELIKFKLALGNFGKQIATRNRDTINPTAWWALYRSETPNLQRLTIQVLSLTCSSFGCKRNWSAFEYYNEPLRERYHKRMDLNLIQLYKFDSDCTSEWAMDPRVELVLEGEDLTWLDVDLATGANEEEQPNTRAQRGTTRSSRTSTPSVEGEADLEEAEEEEKYVEVVDDDSDDDDAHGDA
ncbi:uncharacterized protein LOC110007615 [Amborella trichopoda]|uniref:uncharacterized protein LOC110007615 n=1 Tax=Amborella trichopoda TaxID=13333 RepID=UPI0009BEDF6D|nr:uncharacterized protein LOC110007615 [Amborella trichopoda]|eukprot:XP_020525384.1 uncharacterized protein LOC110007615 [Amborella trichopoda]